MTQPAPNINGSYAPLSDGEEFVELEPDPDLFGTDDLLGIDELKPADEKPAE